jgi:hypothetical protein
LAYLRAELDHVIEMANELDEWSGRVVEAVWRLHWLAFTLAMEACARSEPELMHEALGIHRAALLVRGVIGRPNVDA